MMDLTKEKKIKVETVSNDAELEFILNEKAQKIIHIFKTSVVVYNTPEFSTTVIYAPRKRWR